MFLDLYFQTFNSFKQILWILLAHVHVQAVICYITRTLKPVQFQYATYTTKIVV